MIYYTLTGRAVAQPNRDNDIRPPQRSDFPHMGAVLAKFKGGPRSLPGYVAMPEVAVRSSLEGEYKRTYPQRLRGGAAGFLGPRFDPLAVNGRPGTPGAIPALALPEDVSAERFEKRSALLSLLDGRHPSAPPTKQFESLHDMAVTLTGSASRGHLRLFSFDGESANTRQRYGEHAFGQAMLMARRLTEAGVPMVAIHFNHMTVCDGWDTHNKNFDALKTELLPMLDQGLSALLGDLDERGRLEETLVVSFGEFGRTPKINNKAGRDHWGSCSSAFLAGGGIRGGQVVGQSDGIGAFPEKDPVDPVDLQATIYHRLGLDPEQQRIDDQSQRPWPVSTGRIISPLV